ncbi:MAG TPA: hemerythrin domain-containing protein [Terriglobales bacterium]|nr:hemerythrin domain-containing protein [Terriglobales bacterium]
MLNQISPAKSQPKTEDAVDLLTGCHDRIRHFTGVAVKLAHALDAPRDEVVQAAAGVHRYYTVSLPLHEADEEQTLRPRLDAIENEKLHHALAAMSYQHLAIDDLLERLLPLLVLVRNNPDALAAAGGEMCSITKALDEIFRAHLQMEEEVIFPAIRSALPQAMQSEMLNEMQERRTQAWNR